MSQPKTSPSEILCIFSRPMYSHQAVFRSITEKLVERGHKITVMTSHPSEFEKSNENVTLIDVSSSIELFNNQIKEMTLNKTGNSFMDMFHAMADCEAEVVRHQLESPGMQKLLKNKNQKFDLLFIETGGFAPFFAFSERFKIPVVAITSADAFAVSHEIMGNVINPVAHPERILPFTIAKTFKQRIISILICLALKFVVVPRSEKNYLPMLREYFPEVKKSVKEVVQNIDMLFVNAHPVLGFIRPILPNTIQLGFLHIKPPKPLPEDLLEILDNSKHGVIFMSFGTVVFTELFEKNLEAFVEAFEDLPYDVMWKLEADRLKEVPKNVHLRSFFPQSDLLAHQNVKLVITHGVSLKLI